MKICIPIRAKSPQEAKKQVKKALERGMIFKDLLLEVWLDALNPGFCRFLRSIPKPCIAVCRGPEEKGTFKGTEASRIEMLKSAAKCGAKFVDVGIQTVPALIKSLKKVCRKSKTSLIISSHFWDATPAKEELLRIVRRAKNLGADIVKIAAKINKWSDNVILFEVTSVAVKMGIKIISVGMGKRGKISRLGCPMLGSYLTYAALDKKSKTASGQMTFKEFANYSLLS